jgi:thiol-disulfide isomerase/thioredoxin
MTDDTNNNKEKPATQGNLKRRPSAVKPLIIIMLGLVAVMLFTTKPRKSFDFDQFAAEDALMNAEDPAALLLDHWNSGIVPKRRFALLNVRNRILNDEEPLWREFFYQHVVPNSYLDPDIQIRELTLSALVRVHALMKQSVDSAFGEEQEAKASELDAFEKDYLLPACLQQISDADPHVKALGIRFARNLADKAPLVLAAADCLRDSDTHLVSQAAAFLQMATQQDFGIRLKDMNEKGDAQAAPGIQEKIQSWVSFIEPQKSEFEKAAARIRKPQVSTPHLSHDYMDLQFQTMDGNSRSIESLKGKMVILSFWASWCTPCIDELPALNEVQGDFEESVRIFPVSLDGVPSIHGIKDDNGNFIDNNAGNTAENRQKIESMVDTLGLELEMVWDYRNEIAGRYNGDELPTHAIYDTTGHLARVFTGSRSADEWRRIITAILDNPIRH